MRTLQLYLLCVQSYSLSTLATIVAVFGDSMDRALYRNILLRCYAIWKDLFIGLSQYCNNLFRRCLIYILENWIALDEILQMDWVRKSDPVEFSDESLHVAPRSALKAGFFVGHTT